MHGYVQLWMVQFNIPTFTCPAVNVASWNVEDFDLAKVQLKYGEAGDGPLHLFSFIYTACPYAQKIKTGQGINALP